MMPRTEQRASDRFRNAEGQSYISMLLSRHLVLDKFPDLRTEYQENLTLVFSLLMGNRSKGFNEFLVKLVPVFTECWEKEPFEGTLCSAFFNFALKIPRKNTKKSTWSKRAPELFEDLQNSFVCCFTEYQRNPEDKFILQIFSVPYTDAFIAMLRQMKEDFHLDVGLLHQYLPFILAYTQHYHRLDHAREKLGYYVTRNSQDRTCRLLAYEDPVKNVYVYGFNNHNQFECCGLLLIDGRIDFHFTAPEKTFPLELQCADATDFQKTAFALWGAIPRPDFPIPEHLSDDDDNHSLGFFMPSPRRLSLVADEVDDEEIEDWREVMAVLNVVIIKDLAQELLQEIIEASDVDRTAIYQQHPEMIAEAMVTELDCVINKFKTVATEVHKQDDTFGTHKELLQDLLVFATDHTKTLSHTFASDQDLDYLIEDARVVNTHLKRKYDIAKAQLIADSDRCPPRIRLAAEKYLTEEKTTFDPDKTLPDAVGSIKSAIAHTDRSVGKLADGLRAEYEEAKEDIAKCVEMVNISPPLTTKNSPEDAHMRDDDL
jgi:hypothetical protein